MRLVYPSDSRDSPLSCYEGAQTPNQGRRTPDRRRTNPPAEDAEGAPGAAGGVAVALLELAAGSCCLCLKR